MYTPVYNPQAINTETISVILEYSFVPFLATPPPETFHLIFIAMDIFHLFFFRYNSIWGL